MSGFERAFLHFHRFEVVLRFRGMRGGKVLDNLYVAGAVLGGFNAVKEGCGGGVSILTALAVAQQIMDKRKIG